MNDQYLVCRGEQGDLRIWDISLNDDLIVSGSAHDRTVRICNVMTGEELKRFNMNKEVKLLKYQVMENFSLHQVKVVLSTYLV